MRTIDPHLWTVLPVRGIARGKTRLAGILDAAARARLNRWLLTRTLDVIESWRGDLGRCVVVSRCAEVFEMASARGAPVICEIDAQSDQNRAASTGAIYAMQRSARKLALLPADLPDMNAEALEALTCEAQCERHLALAPDVAGTGTNAVVLDAHAHAGLCFGVRSFPRYLDWAASEGWNVSVCTRPELTFDLDTPADWDAWIARTEEARAIV
jgi:2-phospho-L-lactate/phosphoenolpyruvate guanylyltransferase